MAVSTGYIEGKFQRKGGKEIELESQRHRQQQGGMLQLELTTAFGTANSLQSLSRSLAHRVNADWIAAFITSLPAIHIFSCGSPCAMNNAVSESPLHCCQPVSTPLPLCFIIT